MKKFKYTTVDDFNRQTTRPVIAKKQLESLVNEILIEVRTGGDSALKYYTDKFDGVTLSDIAVSEKEFEIAEKQVSDELKQAIETAILNIEKFHKSQLPDTIKKIETSIGVTCWQKNVGIEKVGLYIPGGTAPLFSSVLMLAVPAQIAGCKEVVLTTPAQKDGSINPEILYCAKRLGINKVFKIGGAQAIAALAYGTESVPAVYKIFGPGNQYVTVAKQLVSLDGIAIDMPAGPSEVLIIADETCIPEFVAADLLSQAEHGVDSQIGLLCTNENIINEIARQLNVQLEKLPRKETAQKALENSFITFVDDLNDAVLLSNEYAPEHLILSCKNYLDVAENIVNAGSVFLGNYTPESAGDYASGTNHTLPTNGFARMYSGLNMDAFTKKITFQEATQNGLKKLGNVIELMAEKEQLEAHKNAVTVRLKKLED